MTIHYKDWFPKFFFGSGKQASMTHDGSKGVLKTDETSASDLDLECGAEKTLRLVNTVWDDLRIVPGAFQFAGSSDPNLSTWSPGAGQLFLVYAFNLNDQAFATCQLPHTYKEGTDLLIHLHWTPRDRGVTESGNAVGWKIDYSIANVGGDFPAASTVDLSDTVTGTDDRSEVAGSVSIPGAGIGISAQIMLRIYRTDTGSDDTWVGTGGANSPALLEVDIHHEVDTQGSRQEFIK